MHYSQLQGAGCRAHVMGREEETQHGGTFQRSPTTQSRVVHVSNNNWRNDCVALKKRMENFSELPDSVSIVSIVIGGGVCLFGFL